ncbi:DUF6134 family protein [Mitsuaria sp. GD03876]|uniref:DUF6134 family protein n=1 Tax=Mitsuaria sp. GD03876 TaxID=2975399 RepID=UPI00244AC92C|nr:DUF6134 family protein [Mitsuaria sp. GD03876]MDH0863825.1 DUF6134 family protein [Mitsuaria sp. GD03876]
MISSCIDVVALAPLILAGASTALCATDASGEAATPAAPAAPAVASAPVEATVPPAPATPGGPRTAGTWSFDVRLGGKPIGTHRFVVDGPEDARRVASTARFDVKLLGLTVYRYRHEATERWRGDCLAEIHSRTDDDGKAAQVDQRLEEGAPAPCLMSYAYWHPELTRQRRLLNPQTGALDEVRIERLPDAPIRVGGATVEASRWRIAATSAGVPQDLTLWRDRADGRWIGLDARVKGDRILTYRLP